MSAEGLVWVDDGEARGIPAQFSSSGMGIPLGLGNQEVVVNDFSVEVVGRDVEVGGSSVEVEMHSVGLADGGFP